MASGPWTETRLLAASPTVIAARRWIEFIALLKDGARLDVDSMVEEVRDKIADRNATNRAAEKRLFDSRVQRTNGRIAEARRQRAEIRKALLLDEDA